MIREFTHDDLVALLRWMAAEGFQPDDLVDAVEKPWKYETELAEARQTQPAGSV